jgi:hypothetical protein
VLIKKSRKRIIVKLPKTVSEKGGKTGFGNFLGMFPIIVNVSDIALPQRRRGANIGIV